VAEALQVDREFDDDDCVCVQDVAEKYNVDIVVFTENSTLTYHGCENASDSANSQDLVSIFIRFRGNENNANNTFIYHRIDCQK
jgi:hypothetical protein